MKNRIIKTVFAWLLTVAMLAVLVPTSVFAEGEGAGEPAVTADPDLLIHYDFEGEGVADKLSDKAGGDTNLSVVTTGNTITVDDKGIGALNNVVDPASSTVTGNYAFADGTVKSLTNNNIALATGITKDTLAAQAEESSGTWFLRVKLPNTLNKNVATLLNFRKASNDSSIRPLYLEYKSDKTLHVRYNNVETYSRPLECWPDEWVNLAFVRTYNTTDSRYYIEAYFCTDANREWIRVYNTSLSNIHSSENVIVSLFAECCNGQAGVGLQSKNVIYDDVRYYKKALTDTELVGIVDDLAPVAADTGSDDVTVGLSNHLKMHYDFEGETFEEQVADKAGDVKTNLKSATGNNNVFAFENGEVSTWVVDKHALITDITDDTKNAQKDPDGTWFLRMQLPTASGLFMGFRKGDAEQRPLAMDYDATNKKINVYIGTGSAGEAQSLTSPELKNYDAGEWINLAVVRIYNNSTAQYDYMVKYKIDGETKWTTIAVYSNANLSSSNDVVLSLFTQAQLVGGSVTIESNMTKGVVYDDVRYYDKALTAKELDAIIPTAGYVVMLGAQRSIDTVNDNYSIRLIAEIKQAEWASAGFFVTPKTLNGEHIGEEDKTTATLSADAVYTSILGTVNGEVKTVATAKNGTYLLAVELSDISATQYEEMTLTVVPYAVDGTGEEVRGQGVVITLKDAKIASINWAN